MKITFDGNTRMQPLLSVLEGQAKRPVEAIGHNGISYNIEILKERFGQSCDSFTLENTICTGSTTNQTQRQDRSMAIPSASQNW